MVACCGLVQVPFMPSLEVRIARKTLLQSTSIPQGTPKYVQEIFTGRVEESIKVYFMGAIIGGHSSNTYPWSARNGLNYGATNRKRFMIKQEKVDNLRFIADIVVDRQRHLFITLKPNLVYINMITIDNQLDLWYLRARNTYFIRQI